MLYFLFFCSGLSSLVYQVVWVRQFGNVFGNTIYSASMVVAIFMLGLGAGSFLVGAWADRRYAIAPWSLLRAYAYIELVVASLGLGISLLLPHLGQAVAAASSYTRDASGWHVLSASSHFVRGAMALVLLTPITVLMGGTLTLLIRHLVRKEVRGAGGLVARLYGVNTLGAAMGAFLTDFALVPAAGMLATQLAAVGFNIIAAAGALWLASRQVRLKPDITETRRGPRTSPVVSGFSRTVASRSPLISTSLALALIGFAAMGTEILWFRHFTLLLGGFRGVFSLLLTVILAGIGAGSLAGGWLLRRSDRPEQWLMLFQGLFVSLTLLGLGTADIGGIAAGTAAELWLDARPILLEVGIPALLMGCSFPLANAVVQREVRSVGRQAGVLYLANTVGAVCGAIAAGFLLLPWLGMQGTATVLLIAAAAAIVPLATVAQGSSPGLGEREARALRYRNVVPAAGSLLVAVVALAWWLSLPSDHLISRSLAPPRPGERLLAVSEGMTEVVAVTEAPGRGRGLITNGHPMASTALLDQRYMRALAHIPLLTLEGPARVLVIGFGVGNSTHAATLHPSVERIEVADLSRHVLEHAGHFRDANGGALDDPRVAVYVNDGRQHLQMQSAGTYDLITLEPPPIAHAGVAALYSREFYELARTRLRPGGYLSQWLPAYQVPAQTSLAMVRAFIDVFPEAVLLSGTEAEFLLVGTTATRIEIDPGQIARALARAPKVEADLRRLDLGTATEIVGTFVGSSETLARAVRQSPPVSDDRPLQEYAVRSAIGSGVRGVPAALVDLSSVGAWCPRCFLDDEPVPALAGLDTYLSLLDQAYRAPNAQVAAAAPVAPGPRRILGSAYLGAVVPDTDATRNLIGVTLLREGKYPEAAEAFRDALRRNPSSVDANRNLGTALAETGQPAEAIGYLRRAVQLDEGNGGAQLELGSLLLNRREFVEAASHLRAALRAMPQSAAAHNDLGTALASMGELDEAIAHFKEAVALDPGFQEGRRNLAAALSVRPMRR